MFSCSNPAFGLLYEINQSINRLTKIRGVRKIQLTSKHPSDYSENEEAEPGDETSVDPVTSIRIGDEHSLVDNTRAGYLGYHSLLTGWLIVDDDRGGTIIPVRRRNKVRRRWRRVLFKLRLIGAFGFLKPDRLTIGCILGDHYIVHFDVVAVGERFELHWIC